MVRVCSTCNLLLEGVGGGGIFLHLLRMPGTVGRNLAAAAMACLAVSSDAFAVAPVRCGVRVAAPLPRQSACPRVPLRLQAEDAVAAAPAPAPAAPTPAPEKSAFAKFSDTFSNLFPVWTAAVAVLGLLNPAVLGGIPTSYFTGLLGMLMLSMGITLTLDDFKRVLQRPGVVGLGFLMCYGLMPAMALGLSRLLGLNSAMTAGMVLVGSINGGQASNLCTYIAKGDVALSVLMTTVTTIGAIFMTPLLCKLLLGAIVPVDAVGVAISTIQVVLVPIVLGMLCNAKFPKAVKKIEPFSPIVGVLSTCVLVGSAVAQCAAPIINAGMSLQMAALLLHVVGGIVAYAAC